MIEHKMLELFGGRMDAYGGDDGFAVRRPVTPRLMARHLEGTEGIGIYPVWHSHDTIWVKWGCCDIDTGDWQEAWALATALQAMGLNPFIERSRSKGWHIWVFAQNPVPAAVMRRALKVGYATIGLQAREANPKSERLRPDQLGNYVRLPFKGNLAGPIERQVMMGGWDKHSDGEPIQLNSWFDQFSDGLRVPPSHLERWAKMWKEPERKTITPTTMSDSELKALLDGMPRDLFEFVRTGPKKDRSEGLVALAFKLKRAGYTPQETLGVIDVADRHWGKYVDRPDRDLYLLDIVERTL